MGKNFIKVVGLFFVAALFLSSLSLPTSAEAYQIEMDPFYKNASSRAWIKIEPSVLAALSAENIGNTSNISAPMTTDFLVWLVDQPDLLPPGQLTTKNEKGNWIYSTLRESAEHSQSAIRMFLDLRGVSYHSYFIVNAILVRDADLALTLDLAGRDDVAHIAENRYIHTLNPRLIPVDPYLPQTIEPNIEFINADNVWELGITGQGIVLAAIDTGIQWDHPALLDHYRGWDGVQPEHNYCWWDATGVYLDEPVDDHGHGTMVTGVMVGGEGIENQIGVAPGAKTIHCKALDAYGGGSFDEFLECFEWILAPWDLSGGNPRPDFAPDVLTNSWGFQGGFDGFEAIINVLQAAGILVEASVGGSGPGCATLSSPADYAQILSIGAIDHTGGVLPGVLSFFSARGPSLNDPWAYIPDLMAPGIQIRSSHPTNSYQVWSGTSLSGPHVTGLVGLIWSANPWLRGNIPDTVQILYDTAVPLTGQMGSQCGGDYITGPNNDWGYGTIDALAAVQEAWYYGAFGSLEGIVTDIHSQVPLSHTMIEAVGVGEWLTDTNELGFYNLRMPEGAYTLTATLSGYETETITNVSVISGGLTIQDISLTHLPFLITGTVIDANTDLPIYAMVSVSGGVITSTFSDPETGAYCLSLESYQTYTLTVEADGYGIEITNVDRLNGNRTIDFYLPAGWLMVDPVFVNLDLIYSQDISIPITMTNLGGLALSFTSTSSDAWVVLSPPAGFLPTYSQNHANIFVVTKPYIQPGEYSAILSIDNDTPYGFFNVPVTLTVLPQYEMYIPFIIALKE